MSESPVSRLVKEHNKRKEKGPVSQSPAEPEQKEKIDLPLTTAEAATKRRVREMMLGRLPFANPERAIKHRLFPVWNELRINLDNLRAFFRAVNAIAFYKYMGQEMKPYFEKYNTILHQGNTNLVDFFTDVETKFKESIPIAMAKKLNYLRIILFQHTLARGNNLPYISEEKCSALIDNFTDIGQGLNEIFSELKKKIESPIASSTRPTKK